MQNGAGTGGKGKATRQGVPSRVARRPAPYGSKPGRMVPRGGSGGGTSVYVGNLSWDVSWQDLKDHFKTIGPVLHADVMLEPGTTRSKGCGLVTFQNSRDAANAIAQLHDTELKGRLIFVREDREGGNTFGNTTVPQRGPVGLAPSEGCRVFVRNLPRETTWAELKDMFRQAGNVVRTEIAAAPDGTSKGFGTVLMGSTREAAKAIQLFNESDYSGRILEVRPDAFA